MQAADDGLNNLYQVIEQGAISLDSTLQGRINALRDKREKVLQELAQTQQERPSPQKLSPKQIEFACERLRDMLLDRDTGWGRQLLTALVTDIQVDPLTAKVRGSTAVLDELVTGMKTGTPSEVPSSVPDWRARLGSNQQPLPSEGSTLSIELRAQHLHSSSGAKALLSGARVDL